MRASLRQSCQASANGAGSDGHRLEPSRLARQRLSSAIQVSAPGSRDTVALATWPALVEAFARVRVGMRSSEVHACRTSNAESTAAPDAAAARAVSGALAAIAATVRSCPLTATTASTSSAATAPVSQTCQDWETCPSTASAIPPAVTDTPSTSAPSSRHTSWSGAPSTASSPTPSSTPATRATTLSARAVRPRR